MTHIKKKKMREMSFAALHKIVDPQGLNFDDVETWEASKVFVHVQPIEFVTVTIAAGESICIIIMAISTCDKSSTTKQFPSRP